MGPISNPWSIFVIGLCISMLNCCLPVIELYITGHLSSVFRLYIYGHNTIIVEVKSYFRLFFEEVLFIITVQHGSADTVVRAMNVKYRRWCSGVL